MPGYVARSAGTSPKAQKTVSAADIRWADLILVMETKHKIRLKAQFNRLLNHQVIHVLNIPDEYQYMDPALIEELKVTVSALLEDNHE